MNTENQNSNEKRIIKINTRPNKYNEIGHFETDHVISVVRKDGSWDRFGIGGWTKEGSGRLVQDGPEVSGPVAYAFGLASVLDNQGGSGAERERNIAAGIETDVVDGDVLEIAGTHYSVQITARGYNRYVYLTAVKS